MMTTAHDDTTLSQWPETHQKRLIYGFLAAIAFVQVGISYLQAAIGKPQLGDDVTHAWQPLMQAVLNEGVPLYTQGATDNKPPLFQFLNLASGLTDHYILAWFLIIGVCNTLAAILLYQWVRDGASPLLPSGRGVGLLAAVLFLGALPLLGGTSINARSPMLVGVLFAVQTDTPLGRGAALATGALSSQYAILGAPVLAYESYRRGRLSELTRYTLGGVAMVVAAFLPVLLIWGWPSVVGGVLDGLLSQYRPVTNQPAANSLVDPYSWARALLSNVERVLFIVAPAAVAVGLHGIRAWSGRCHWYSLPVVLAVVYALPLAVKSLPYYALHVLPFTAVLAAGLIVGVGRED